MCSIRSELPRLAGWLVLLLLLVSVSHAVAAPSEAKGRAHLQRGLELYKLGQYKDAIAEFEQGYIALPRPAFLLNIAQSYRKLDKPERARGYYLQFVDRAPPGDPMRAQALSAIEKIDALLRERAANEPPPDAPPPPPAPRPSPPPEVHVAPPPVVPPTATAVPQAQVVVRAPAIMPRARVKAIGYTGLALAVPGLLGVAAAAVLFTRALSLDDQYAHPVDGTVYDPQLLRERDLDSNMAIGLFIAGGVLTVVGTALAASFLPRLSRSQYRTYVGVTPELAGGLRVAVGGVF